MPSVGVTILFTIYITCTEAQIDVLLQEVSKFNNPQIRLIVNATSCAMVPSFLQGGDSEIEKKFVAMVSEPNLTIEEIKQRIEHWLTKQPQNIKDAYKRYIDEMNKCMIRIQENIADSRLSADAKGILKQLDEITDDSDLTLSQQAEQIAVVLQTLPPNISNELEKFFS